MLDSLVQSIENAFVHFSFRRLLYVAFLIALVGAGLYIYNEATGYTLFHRVDSEIGALERLQVLERAGIEQSPQLRPLYRSVVRELGMQPSRPFDYSFDSEPLLKFLGAALVPLFFVVVGAFQMLRREPDAAPMFTGALALTFLLGMPAVLIPTWRTAWLTAGVFFLVQIVVLTALVYWSNSRERTRSATQAG